LQQRLIFADERIRAPEARPSRPPPESHQAGPQPGRLWRWPNGPPRQNARGGCAGSLCRVYDWRP
jgi:hypothetical protein